MIGKNLIELELPKRFGVIVAAVRNTDSGEIHQPDPSVPLKETDSLVIVSGEDAIPKLLKGK
jgi:trk system potassium uptake protein TrkA